MYLLYDNYETEKNILDKGNEGIYKFLQELERCRRRYEQGIS